jgi:tRNA threonylcarbamoyl adenosine modification protein (Sua5/YciO/YrdC/YwlC family)
MLLTVYPDSINQRHIQKVVDCLKSGGVVIIPTDTVYAFACDIYSSKAIERISKIKNIKLAQANFSFACYDLSDIATYTKPFSREVFRIMKHHLPGPFTFILNASSEVPTIFRSNKKTIGIRVPDNNITREIVKELGNPIMVSSVHDEDEIKEYYSDASEIESDFSEKVDIIIDGGYSDIQPSTVIDCTSDTPVVIREGKGKLEEID